MPPTAVPSPSATVSPTPAPSEGAVLEPAAYGPLAVIPPQDGTDLTAIQGVLSITETCVRLDERGRRVLLVWPADLVRWNRDRSAVTFRNEDGRETTGVHGQRVVLGGSGSMAGVEGGAPTVTWAQTIDWVVPPDSSCLEDARWFVGAMGPPG